MIDTSFERPKSQLSSAVSKISKMSRLLSFRLNLIWAKITQFSKLNNFVMNKDFFLKLDIHRALLNAIKCLLKRFQFGIKNLRFSACL